MNAKDIAQRFDIYFGKVARKLKNNSSIQILVYSEKLGISYNYPLGEKEIPFHIASIGKVFTSTLLFILIERGLISLSDLVVNYLPDSQLKTLFFFDGVDYSNQVTIKDLMAHTSGVADYFEDPVTNGIPFLEDVTRNSNTFFTPDMLLDFSRYSQKAVGKPGTAFHYSDTGYILLGNIIEKVTAKPFHANLHEEFFAPLGMDNSYLMFDSSAERLKKTSYFFSDGSPKQLLPSYG
jgi:D-alanyl-D-alanine carboxypeptidase